jgi:hypothetical protein
VYLEYPASTGPEFEFLTTAYRFTGLLFDAGAGMFVVTKEESAL